MSLLIGLTMMAAFLAPTSQEVTFKGAGGLELHGTYTLPAGAPGTKFPGVVLLPGSGPTDRDGNQLPNLRADVLKQISDDLVAAGIATLRFDKRAAPTYRDIFMKLSPDDLQAFIAWSNFVEDATDAYKYLRSQPNVDGKRVALLGHSEGALITLSIGANMADDPGRPAALVTIGGTGRPMGPVLHDQISRQLSHQPEAVQKMYMNYTDAAIAQITKDGTLPAGDPPAGLGTLFNKSTVKLLQSYFTTDPVPLAAKCKGPVLVVNGEKDTQVSAEKDAPRLEEALKNRSGNGTVKLYIVPNASHNLKETTEANRDVFTGPIVPSALAAIRAFLVKELRS